MDDSSNKTNTHLHTFIDGRLDKSNQLKAHAFLQKHSEKNTEFKSYQATDKQIRAALDDVYQTIPGNLIDIIDNFEPLVGKTSWWKNFIQNLSFPLIAIHTSIAVFAVFMGFMIAEYTAQTTPEPLENKYIQVARLAVEAHVIYSAEQDYAVELDASKKVELMSWFSKRLGAPVGPADLSAQGYNLIGGRLLPSMGEHAALFMYENSDDNRLTLYIRSNKNISMPIDSEVKCNNSERDMFACSWFGRDLAYIMVGQPLTEKNRTVIQTAAVQLRR